MPCRKNFELSASHAITIQSRAETFCCKMRSNFIWKLCLIIAAAAAHTSFGTCELSWTMHVGKWNWIWVKKKKFEFSQKFPSFCENVRSGMNLFDIKISSTMMDFSTICSLHVGRRSSLTASFLHVWLDTLTNTLASHFDDMKIEKFHLVEHR